MQLLMVLYDSLTLEEHNILVLRTYTRSFVAHFRLYLGGPDRAATRPEGERGALLAA